MSRDPGAPHSTPDAFTSALDHLSRRDRSLAELEEYLKKKEFSEGDIAAALKRLVELGYLDEDRLARAIIRDTRMASRGPRAAWLKLKKKKIAGWALDRVMGEWREGTGSAFAPRPEAETAGQDPETELALAFIRRRYPGYGSDRKQAARALGALVRRGFSYGVAKSVLGIPEE